ncbi:hypothetical protein H671_2g6517 [Cricetulus griseus]|uniref:Uncharacterized protein n=1 Tax=Cricetulus griseus TaxID=10029 RepID=A0A061IDZ3_CRIGR|nr:hypothetical protein H671_2g6517 [Cricetulus griseus]
MEKSSCQIYFGIPSLLKIRFDVQLWYGSVHGPQGQLMWSAKPTLLCAVAAMMYKQDDSSATFDTANGTKPTASSLVPSPPISLSLPSVTVEGHLGCFQVLAVLNKASMNMIGTRHDYHHPISAGSNLEKDAMPPFPIVVT